MPPYITNYWKDEPMIGTAAALGMGASALTGLFGAHKQAQSNDKALKSSEAANAAALAYEREKDAKAEAAEMQRQQRLQPLLQARYSLLSKYGIKIPTAGMMGGPEAPSAGTQPPPIMGGQGMQQEVGPEIQRDPRAEAAMAMRRRTLGDLPDWSRNAWMGGSGAR